MTRDFVLKWIERGLLAIGVVLAAWCAAVLVEARFHQAATVSDRLVVTQTAIPWSRFRNIRLAADPWIYRLSPERP